ncbi:hypothetical protein ACW73Q_04420 [Faecalibacterium duncaniae]
MNEYDQFFGKISEGNARNHSESGKTMCRLHKKLCEVIIKQKRTDLTNGPSSAKIVPAQRIIHTLERLNFISQEVKRRIKRRPFAGKNALRFAGKGRARRIPK